MVMGGVLGGPTGSEPARPVSVVVVDDRPVVARGLRATFEEAAHRVTLVGVLDRVDEIDGMVAEVALLELALRDASRPRDNVSALRARGMSVVAYTGVYDVRLLVETVDAGAAAVVLKHQPEEVLLEAIERARRGETYLPDDVARHIAEGEALRPRLSAREVEVLNLLFEGLITKQAARRLQVSESTVKEHLKRVRTKYATLGRSVSTRVQLLQAAERDGFISRDRLPAEE